MPFKKYLSENALFMDRDFSNWEEALKFLSGEFERKAHLSRREALALLKQREEIGSTWVGYDTAIPHNHSPKIEGVHILLVRTNKPVELPDGNHVRYIFSLLTSGNEGNTYLAILQEISQLMMNERKKLDDCKTPSELLNLINETCHLTGRTLNASDLAAPWPIIDEQASIGKALDLMKQHGVYFLPVQSKKTGKLCGVLDLVDLLKAGFPDYVFSLSDLSLIQDFKPVKFFWSREEELKVGDFMRDYRPYVIRSESSYPELFFLMIKGNRRHLLVMNPGDKFKGVIRPTQIIDKMLRP
ncbi:MAG: PTS sugar transporter subunit IIA [Spirochaetales bacterium]|nr:PTS sugar transporter subunit IIA [Spirochaetales bacterium]